MTASSPLPSRALAHVPALDGARGVAVIAVLLFHGGMTWLPGGFLGVDAFFVLSGYLITGILLAGPVDLRAFWERRARRLVPALAALVGVLLVVAAVAPLNAGVRDALASLTYLSNWRFIASGGGYFDSFEEPSVFKHTWSLAVEGQFYLLWPLVVVSVCKRSRGAVLAAAASGALVSAWAMGRSYSPYGDLNRAYFGTDTRMQAVLVGAALAVVLARLSVFPRRPLMVASGGVGAVLTLWLWHSTNGTAATLYRGGFLLAAVATAAVIACVVAVPDGRLAKALSVRPLRLVGMVSYGVYLWHWPVFLLLTAERTHLTGVALLLLRCAVTGGLAAASWRLVEVPARDWSMPSIVVVKRAAIGSAVAVLVLSSLTWIRLPAPPTTPAAAEPASSAQPSAKPPKPGKAKPAAVGSAAPAKARPSATPSAVAPPRTGPAKVLFLGDSVALTLAQGLRDGDGFDVSNAAILGCGIVSGGPFRYFGNTSADLPQCAQWPTTWTSSIRAQRPDVVAVLVGRWECMDRMHDGRWTHLGEPAYDAYVTAELERMVGVVSSSGAKVVLMTAPYYKRGERPDGGRFPEDDPARVDRFNQLLREVAGRHPEVRVVDLNSQLAPEGVFTKRINGTLVRYDGVHISSQGAQLVRPWLFGELRAAL